MKIFFPVIVIAGFFELKSVSPLFREGKCRFSLEPDPKCNLTSVDVCETLSLSFSVLFAAFCFVFLSFRFGMKRSVVSGNGTRLWDASCAANCFRDQEFLIHMQRCNIFYATNECSDCFFFEKGKKNNNFDYFLFH